MSTESIQPPEPDPEEKKPTIYDVAREAGVSFVTVSRAFNDHRNVSDTTRDRVFDAARRLGYQSRLVSRPRSITLVTPAPGADHALNDLSLMCLYLSQQAKQHDMLCRCVSVDSLPELIRFGTDGIVEVGLETFPFAGRDDIPDIPVVLTQNRTSDPRWYSVTVDYQREAREALALALDRGHRRVGILFPALDRWTVRCRLDGLAEARLAMGVDRRQTGIYSSAVLSLPELDDALRSAGCTCLISFDSDRVLPLLDYFFNQSGRSIPGDLSLLLLDNLGVTAHYHPRVSAIRQPLDTIAERAVAHIAGKEKARTEPNVLVPSILQPGLTCVPPA
jgi:DNA-binding LacI/PurR family transcriptional regulator